MVVDKYEVKQLDSVRAWIICLLVALFFFYDFVQMTMCNSLSKHLMHDFDLTETGLSRIASTFLLADIIFLFPAGIIIDRVSTRKITLLMLSLSIIGTLGVALSHSLYLVLCFRFVAGIAHAFCFLCCISFATRWFSSKRQAFVIGLMITIGMFGGLFAQKPLLFLADNFGWRDALFLNVSFGLLVLCLIYLYATDYPKERTKDNESYVAHLAQIGFFPSLLLVVSNLQNWLLGLYTGLLNLPIMVLGAVFSDLYLQQVFSLSKSQASDVSGMIFLGTIVGAPIVGKISDRLGLRKLPMLVGAVFSLITLTVVFYTHTFGFYELLILFFLLGLFTSAQIISYPALNENNSQALSSTAVGLAGVIIMGLGLLGQNISGYLLNLFNDMAVRQQFLYAFYPISGGMVLSVLITFVIRETYCRPLEQN